MLAQTAVSISELALSVVAGSLTTLSPCVFPLLPLVAGGAAQANRLAPLAMGAGMALSFAALGLLLGTAGAAWGFDGDGVRTFAAWMLIVFAVVMLVPALNARFGTWLLPLADRANTASAGLNSASLSGAFALGALLGLIWSPCSGSLLASALALVASEGGALRGASMLGLFGLGAALPLMTVAYLSRNGLQVAKGRVMQHAALFKTVFGVLLGLTGGAILTGADKWLEARIVALLPDGWVTLTTYF